MDVAKSYCIILLQLSKHVTKYLVRNLGDLSVNWHWLC